MFWAIISPLVFVFSSSAMLIHTHHTPIMADKDFYLTAIWAVVALLSAFGMVMLFIFFETFRDDSLDMIRFVFSRDFSQLPEIERK